MDDQIVPQNSITSTESALKKTLAIICGKWRLHIIFQLGTEARRYGELRRMIPDVSEKVLIQELKALIELGVLEKKSYREIPPRVEYSLTMKGLQVLPTLLNLITVGETFLNEQPLVK
ncbi:MAG: helix-turn-helix transcriptional regulator [Spirosoma sp.]|nr:helix-turn-helix transcriptional regulator [Spirosoma sp.]